MVKTVVTSGISTAQSPRYTRRDAEDVDTPAPTPDTDPRHLDPAGDLADLFESDDLAATVDDDADREELEEWLARAEAGEFGADPGVEATVRIVRALLDDDESDAVDTDTDR